MVAGSLPLLEPESSSGSRTSSGMVGFRRGKSTGMTESGLGAQQTVQMPAVQSLSTTQHLPEIKATTKASL